MPCLVLGVLAKKIGPVGPIICYYLCVRRSCKSLLNSRSFSISFAASSKMSAIRSGVPSSTLLRPGICLLISARLRRRKTRLCSETGKWFSSFILISYKITNPRKAGLFVHSCIFYNIRTYRVNQWVILFVQVFLDIVI